MSNRISAAIASGMLLLFTAILPAADQPVSVDRAAKIMTAPQGFEVTLFAGEPDVVQPIAMTFDDRGRLWAVECRSYPNWVTTPTGPDRVVIFEDTNGDGKMDRRKVFLENGANLTGIAYGFGGIWLTSVPNLIFIPDRNHDDIPDGPATILLDGWDRNAKHNVVNGLRWGPDGWLWGCNGILSNSNVGKPGASDAERTKLNCGVWRYHPTQKRFEAVAHGTTNPWGLDFDQWGEAWITNCVIDHLFHVTPGGHYQRMFGQDVMPHSYELMPSAVDYQHWAGGHWTESRGGKGKHSDAGGGHAHSGAAIVLDDRFPPEYQNSLLTCNIHGNRLNRDALERTPTGAAGRRRPDFIFANDEWFRGIAVQMGPNGIYYSDWSDTGECHNYVIADRTNGRIYQARYGNFSFWKGDLSQLSDLELAQIQSENQEWKVRTARRILQERALERSIQKEALDELSKLLTQGNPIQRLRALWTMHAIQGDSSAIAKLLLNNSDESVRVWAIRFITEPQKIAAQTDQLLHALAKSEQSGFVRLNLAAALQRLPVDRRIPIALALSAHGADSQDRAIPKMLWYGIEPIVSQYPDRIRELVDTCQIPMIRQNTARRLVVQSNPRQNGTTLILSYLADQKNPEVQYDLLVGMQLAYAGRRNVAMPPEWKQIAPKLLASESNLVREKATEIAVLYQDRDAIELLRNRLESNQETLASRRRALEILQQQQSDTLVSPLLKLLDHPELRGDAIRALAAFSQPEIAKAIVERYSSFTESERQDAITTLASRPQFALKMMEAIQKQVIHRQDVSLVVVRQMQGYRDAQVKVEFQKIWSIVGSTSAERVKKANELRTKYTPEVMKSANLSNGRRLYAQNCASCHRLFDDGGLIGPELTGSQRAKLDYVLENVLDPNAIVPKDYQVTIIELDSGRLLNGIVKEESEKTVTLQTTNEKITFPKSEIVSRTQASHSLMPEGILEKLNEAEVRDLLAYLASPAQVPLPKE